MRIVRPIVCLLLNLWSRGFWKVVVLHDVTFDYGKVQTTIVNESGNVLTVFEELVDDLVLREVSVYQSSLKMRRVGEHEVASGDERPTAA